MSDTPKELQSAYQRWEMASFGDNRPSVVARNAPPPPAAPLPPELIPPTEEELAAIRAAAHADGEAIGFEAGSNAGYIDGLEKGRAEAAEELAHLQTISATFARALATADEVIANDVLDLALHLARGMLRVALPIKPELMLPIVRDAIAYLPVVQQPAVLMLNPLDVDMVRGAMGDDIDKGGWRVIEDASIERGGCKVDTASNQIDAQVEARWQRLNDALAKDVDWLDT
ncbi:MAG TPA: flagellar assembly protein FliH [Telluria sp.]